MSSKRKNAFNDIYINKLNLSNAHLEHILPVSSNGGAVLFNCIPILNKINLSKSDEPNLLTWWQGKGKEYFSYNKLELELNPKFP